MKTHAKENVRGEKSQEKETGQSEEGRKEIIWISCYEVTDGASPSWD